MTSHREGGATTAPDTWELFTPYGSAKLMTGDTEWTYSVSVCDICSALVLGIDDHQELHARWHYITSGQNRPWRR